MIIENWSNWDWFMLAVVVVLIFYISRKYSHWK